MSMDDLVEARREVAIGRALLAAAWEREKHQQAVISGLRAELLAAHDIAGRAEPYLYIGKGPAVVVNPFREFSQDRRRVGG
jgi:hypothetical protein